MKDFRVLFFRFTLLFCFLLYCNSEIVSTSYGDLDGDQIGEFHLFKKIPFARPPLGKLRFQKPEEPEKWDSVRNAKGKSRLLSAIKLESVSITKLSEYGPACLSNSTVTTSPQKWVDEDCLHVNIFTSSKCLVRSVLGNKITDSSFSEIERLCRGNIFSRRRSSL